MNPVIHFEMPAEDRKRMANFYTNVFGWQTQQLGEEMSGYVLAGTTESDEKGRPKTPGTINGGFYQKTDKPLSHAPSVVISVPDIQGAMKAVEAGGGKILGAMDKSGNPSMEPIMIPGVGLWISFQDTEG